MHLPTLPGRRSENCRRDLARDNLKPEPTLQTTAPVAPQPQPPQPQPPQPPPPPLAADQPPPPLPPPLTAEQQQQQHKEILARDLQERDRLFWELLHDFVDTYHQQQLHQQQQQQQQQQHDQLPPVPATAELVGDGMRGRRQRQLWDLPVGLQPTVVIFGSAKFATASKGSAASPPRQIRADLEASDFCAFLLANERLTSTVRLQRSPAPCSVPAPWLTRSIERLRGAGPGRGHFFSLRGPFTAMPRALLRRPAARRAGVPRRGLDA